MNHKVILMAAIVLLAPAPAAAQYADWYLWHNEVEPSVQVTVTIDSVTGDFRYRYTIANGPGARQRIESLELELEATPTGMAAPKDWQYSFDSSTPVVGWWADGPDDPAWMPMNEMDIPSTLSEIAPGDSLTGFDLLSPCAIGGPVPYYARGYNHVAVQPPDDTTSWVRVPDWRDDAVRGTVAGPGDCGVVKDWGNRRPAVDGFVGLVNFRDGDVLPAGPVTVQLRFSRDGEQVDRESLTVELNRVDVTSAFRTNSIGDAVAIFQPGQSPLRSGRNVLLVSVRGVVPGKSQTAEDADRFTFTIP